MTDTEDTTAETLQPEDFAIFGGFALKDGQQMSCWILGPDIITSFGMEVDNVDISVREGGILSIKPKVQKDCMGGFSAGPGFWERTSNLQLQAT